MLSGTALALEDCTLLSLTPEVVSLVGVDDRLGVTVLAGSRLTLATCRQLHVGGAQARSPP